MFSGFPNNMVGVGIPDFGLRNRALLNKWIFRFCNEHDSYWKQVVSACVGKKVTGFLPSVFGIKGISWMWNQISKPLTVNDEFSSVISQGTHISIGNGGDIQFWFDLWVGDIVLRCKFPRIFALSVKKSGSVAEFGEFNNGIWHWIIPLRRELFDWEKEQWSNMLQLLDSQHISSSKKDCLMWSASGDGSYSTKSFCYSYFALNFSKCPLSKYIWAGCAPPKVEVFVWQLLKNRVATKDELLKRSIISLDSAQCVLCGEVTESNSHLFFSCPFSWNLWQLCCRLWGVEWVLHNDPNRCFEAWIAAFPSCQNKEIWCMMFFAVTWSIWLNRNDFIFRGKISDVQQVFDLVKVRLAHWIKARWSEIGIHFDDILRCPQLINAVQKSRPLSTWSPPMKQALKFNVDASVDGNPGFAGIGGILRNADGKALLLFSKSAGFMSPTLAEFCAIKEACSIFIASKWAKNLNLIVENDCSVVVDWMNGVNDIRTELRNSISALLESCAGFGITFVHCVREVNMEADRLAKDGVKRSVPLLHFI